MSTPLYIENKDKAITSEKMDAIIRTLNAISAIVYGCDLKDIPDQIRDMEIILTNTAPETSTPGELRQLLIHNTGTNNNLYCCTKIDEERNEYTWSRVGGSGGGGVGTSDADTLEGFPAAHFAPIDSPAFAGTPTAEDANMDSGKSIVNVNTLLQAISNFSAETVSKTYAPLNGPVFTGVPTTPTAANTNNSLQVANTAFVQNVLGNYAKKASPAFTGTPTAPTAAQGTSTTQIATTAFVQAEIENSKIKEDTLDSMAMMSYHAFCARVNMNSINCAFGMNNEDKVKGVGRALAMYARFVDPTIDINSTFPNLIQCNTLDDFTPEASVEAVSNPSIKALLAASEYANTKTRFVQKLWVAGDDASVFTNASINGDGAACYSANGNQSGTFSFTPKNESGTLVCYAYLNCSYPNRGTSRDTYSYFGNAGASIGSGNCILQTDFDKDTRTINITAGNGGEKNYGYMYISAIYEFL